jgi:hypothetical protein
LGELTVGTCGAITVRKKVDGKWIDKSENYCPSPIGPESNACRLVPCWVYYWGYQQFLIAQKSEKFKFCLPGTCESFARKFCKIFRMLIISKLKGSVSHK